MSVREPASQSVNSQSAAQSINQESFKAKLMIINQKAKEKHAPFIFIKKDFVQKKLIEWERDRKEGEQPDCRAGINFNYNFMSHLTFHSLRREMDSYIDR